MSLPAIEILTRYADHPSAYLAINRETRHFTAPDCEGMIAYRFAGARYVVIVAGIMAAPAQRAALLERFLEWARAQRRKVIAVQFFRDDAELLVQRGFRVNQIGASYSVALPKFKLAGTPFMKLRNKISRARRDGVEVLELGVELETTEDIRRKLHDIDASWLNSKGRHTKELAFLIGEIGDLTALDRSLKRLFVAVRNGEVLGYILYAATFGAYRGWMHDLTRRVPDAPPGVMELINLTAIERFKAEQVPLLNLGFTPLTSLDREQELPSGYSPITGWLVRKLAKYGSFIYPAETQLQYKLKWAPDVIRPEYIAFQGGFSLGGLWSFLRLTHAI